VTKATAKSAQGKQVKRAADLKAGDFVIVEDEPSEVTYTQQAHDYDGIEPRVLVVFAAGYVERWKAEQVCELATTEQIAAARFAHERTEEIAKLRAFLTWLEAHPHLPAPGHLRAQASLFGPWPDQLAAITRAAETMGREVQRTKGYDGRPTAKVELQVGNVDFVVYASDDRRNVERRCETCGEDLALIEAGRLGHVPGEECAPVEQDGPQ
jgi:hypothetical protein